MSVFLTSQSLCGCNMYQVTPLSLHWAVEHCERSWFWCMREKQIEEVSGTGSPIALAPRAELCMEPSSVPHCSSSPGPCKSHCLGLSFCENYYGLDDFYSMGSFIAFQGVINEGRVVERLFFNCSLCKPKCKFFFGITRAIFSLHFPLYSSIQSWQLQSERSQ